jgi:SAM-dependent methyltransferase
MTVAELDRETERAKYLRLRTNPRYGGSNHGASAIPFIETLRPRTLVDLGCGRNGFCQQLREQGIIARGVDFAFAEADISAPMHAVPLENGFADVVTAFDSFEHLLPDEVDEVIAEAARLAKPGGRFIATICTRASKFEPGLHPTVRPLEWWLSKLARVMRIDQRAPYIVGTFGGVATVVPNPQDSAAIDTGLRLAKPGGMTVWTTGFKPANLSNWLRGRHAFLVCSGPSLADLDLSLLSRRGIVTLGVNNSWLVHRPTMWTCVDHPNRFADVGWKDAGITKFLPAEHCRAWLRTQRGDGTFRRSNYTVADMPSVWLYRRGDGFDHRRFLGTDSIAWGCPSSVFDSLGINGKRSVMQAAIGLLAYLGASTVYLIGADFKMTADSRYAFDESRTPQAVRHNSILYEALDRRFAAMRPHFEERGFRVLNATPGSGLTAFDRIEYAEAIDRASAESMKPTGSRGWYEPSKGDK